MESAIWKGTVCQSQAVSLALADLFQEVQEIVSGTYMQPIHCKIWDTVHRVVASPLFSQDCEWSALGYLILSSFCTKLEIVTYCSYFRSWHSTGNICSPQLIELSAIVFTSRTISRIRLVNNSRGRHGHSRKFFHKPVLGVPKGRYSKVASHTYPILGPCEVTRRSARAAMRSSQYGRIWWSSALRKQVRWSC